MAWKRAKMSAEEEKTHQDEGQLPTAAAAVSASATNNPEGGWKKGDLLEPDTLLNLALLSAMGIEPEEAPAFLGQLIAKRYKRWADLQIIESKDEAIALLEDKNIGRKIWNFVQEKKKEPAGAQTASRSLMPIRTHPESFIHDISKFFHKELCKDKTSLEQLPKRVRQIGQGLREEFTYELVQGMYSADEKDPQLFIRWEIQEILLQLLEFFFPRSPNSNRSPNVKALMLIGSKGCGKSTIARLLVILLVLEGHPVLYKVLNTRVLILPKDISQEDAEILRRAFKTVQIQPIAFENDHPSVLEVGHGGALDDVEEFLMNNISFVHDIGEDTDANALKYNIEGVNKRLIVTSPNAGKITKFLLSNMGKYEFLTVPGWSLEQVKQLKRPETLSVEKVRERHWKFGGGAVRRIMQDPALNVRPAEDCQEDQVFAVRPDVLTNVLFRTRYDQLPAKIEKQGTDSARIDFDLIYSVEPFNNKEGYHVVVASQYVGRRLAIEYILRKKLSSEEMLRSLDNVPGLSKILGCYFESSFHAMISSEFATDGRQKTHFDILGLTDGEPRIVKDNFGDFCLGKISIFDNIEDLESIKEEALYIPLSSNFETIDSFSVVPRQFMETCFPGHRALEVKDTEHFLLFFQATLSKSHSVHGKVLKDAAQLISARFFSSKEKQLPFTLVFATTRAGISKRQAVTFKKQVAIDGLDGLNKKQLQTIATESGIVFISRTKIDELKRLIRESEATKGSPGESNKRHTLVSVRAKYEDQDSFGPQYALVLKTYQDALMKRITEVAENKMAGEEDDDDIA